MEKEREGERIGGKKMKGESDRENTLGNALAQYPEHSSAPRTLTVPIVITVEENQTVFRLLKPPHPCTKGWDHRFS